MRQTRVSGLARDDLLENGASLELFRVGLVGRERGGRNRERVENHGFVIVRVCRSHLRHAVTVGEQPRPLVDCFGVRVEVLNGVEVAGLAWRPGPDRPGARDSVASLLQRCGWANARRERIAPAAERNAPFRHGARGIGFQRRVESLDRVRELEGVEQCDRAVEQRLRRRAARRRKAHRAKLFGCGRTVLVLLRECRAGQEHSNSQAALNYR